MKTRPAGPNICGDDDREMRCPSASPDPLAERRPPAGATGSMQSRDGSAEDGEKRDERLRPSRRRGMDLVQSVIRASGAGPMSIEAQRTSS